MKIATASRPAPLRRIQHSIYVPHGSAALSSEHKGELMKAMSVVAIKNVGAAGIATGAWKLTTIPQATTHQELADILFGNNITAEKAPVYASEIRQLLTNPWVRTVLFGVCGGASAYLVIEKTRWSRKTKRLATVGAFVVCAALYLLLRHRGILS